MNRFVRTILALAALALMMPGGAHAATRDIASGMSLQDLQAEGGWVVYTEESAEGRRVVGLHGGQQSTITVESRGITEGYDIGTTADGSAVLTYSDCPDGAASSAGSCVMRMVDLTSHVATSISIPGRRGWDTTPSMERGTLVFARSTKRGAVPKLLYLAKGSRHLRVLPTGARPTRSPGRRPQASLGNLNLSGATATFSWGVSDPMWRTQILAVNVRSGGRHVCFNGSQNLAGQVLAGAPVMSPSGLWFVAWRENFEAWEAFDFALLNCSSRTQKRIRAGAVAADELSWFAVTRTTMYTIRGTADDIYLWG